MSNPDAITAADEDTANGNPPPHVDARVVVQQNGDPNSGDRGKAMAMTTSSKRKKPNPGRRPRQRHGTSS